MNKIKAVLAASLLASSAVSVQATILIDYDDGDAGNGIHDAAVRNGGFETRVTAWTYANWVSVGPRAIALEIKTTSGVRAWPAPNGGRNNTILGIEPKNSDTKFPGQNTGHILSLGDRFLASYAWRNASGWKPADTIDFSLFYTDTDRIDGERTPLFTFNSGGEAANNRWEIEAIPLTAGITDSGAVGKTLFIVFEANAPSNSFSRFDNVFLEVVSGSETESESVPVSVPVPVPVPVPMPVSVPAPVSVPVPAFQVLLELGGISLILDARK